MREIKKYLKNKKGVKYKLNTNIGVGLIGFDNGNDIICFPLSNYSVRNTVPYTNSMNELVFSRLNMELYIESNNRELDNFLLNKRSGEKYTIYITDITLEGCFVREYNYHGYDDNNTSTFSFSVDTYMNNQ